MEEAKNKNDFEEYMSKARAICKEYDKKLETIKRQRPIKGRGHYPEETVLRRECDEKIRQLAEQYHNSN